jgi:peptidoglycan/xylan/chitin deacetylase (PgdA/CDA1 family)
VRLLLFLLLVVGSWSGAHAQKRIALSFDDVPRDEGAFFTSDERTSALIEALREGGVRQAAFFVTTGNLDKPHGAGGEERIARYVAAGHVIANHSHSHLWLHQTDAEIYVADLDKAAQWLAGRSGFRPWYRFPYLDEGRRDTAKRDAVRAALAKRGLRNGYVTVDNYDWHLDRLASDARRAGKAMDMDALRDLYVETLVETANFNDRIALKTLGRSPAHVLLLHETDLAALFVDDLAKALRRDGWQIIPIDQAYEDPIAASEPDTWFLGSGRVAALAHVAGMAPRELVHERTDEEVLSKLFAERVLEGEAAPTP